MKPSLITWSKIGTPDLPATTHMHFLPYFFVYFFRSTNPHLAGYLFVYCLCQLLIPSNRKHTCTQKTHWSESESRSVVSNSLQPHGLYSPWNFPGQNTGVGSLSLLQGIFPTQRSNPDLPHCRWILNQLSYKGSPRRLEWVAYLYSRGSSRPTNWTRVFCTVGGFFTNWAIREAQIQVSCVPCRHAPPDSCMQRLRWYPRWDRLLL